MRTIQAAIGALCLLLGLSGLAMAQDTIARIEFGAEVATVVIPEGYVVVKKEAGFAELVPPGQTMENWTDLFSIISADASAGPLEKLRQDLQQSFIAICESKTVVAERPIVVGKGGHRSASWSQYCEKAKANGLPETDILHVVESKGGYLVVLRGFRSAITDEVRGKWASFLGQSKIAKE